MVDSPPTAPPLEAPLMAPLQKIKDWCSYRMGYIRVVADDARAELPSTSSGPAQSQEFGARQEAETSTMKKATKKSCMKKATKKVTTKSAMKKATKEVPLTPPSRVRSAYQTLASRTEA